MTVLILGSEGFIGAHCVKYFLQKNYSVFGADLFEQATQSYSYNKVSRISPEMDDLFTGTKFDAVVNAAGSGNVPYSMAHPLVDFEANSLDVFKILDTIRRIQPACRYIHLSSAAVYGNPEKLPVLESETLKPLSPYGWHKLISEQVCMEFSQLFQIRSAIIRPFSVYGPGLKKQLFWDTFQKVKVNQQKLELFGTGRESRDFVFIADLVKAIELILLNGEMKAEAYNVASAIETTIEDAVTLFIKVLEFSPEIYFNGQVREGDPKNWLGDIAKIGNLGFKPEYSIEQGLKILKNWIQVY